MSSTTPVQISSASPTKCEKNIVVACWAGKEHRMLSIMIELILERVLAMIGNVLSFAIAIGAGRAGGGDRRQSY